MKRRSLDQRADPGQRPLRRTCRAAPSCPRSETRARAASGWSSSCPTRSGRGSRTPSRPARPGRSRRRRSPTRSAWSARQWRSRRPRRDYRPAAAYSSAGSTAPTKTRPFWVTRTDSRAERSSCPLPQEPETGVAALPQDAGAERAGGALVRGERNDLRPTRAGLLGLGRRGVCRRGVRRRDGRRPTRVHRRVRRRGEVEVAVGLGAEVDAGERDVDGRLGRGPGVHLHAERHLRLAVDRDVHRADQAGGRARGQHEVVGGPVGHGVVGPTVTRVVGFTSAIARAGELGRGQRGRARRDREPGVTCGQHGVHRGVVRTAPLPHVACRCGTRRSRRSRRAGRCAAGRRRRTRPAWCASRRAARSAMCRRHRRRRLAAAAGRVRDGSPRCPRTDVTSVVRSCASSAAGEVFGSAAELACRPESKAPVAMTAASPATPAGTSQRSARRRGAVGGRSPNQGCEAPTVMGLRHFPFSPGPHWQSGTALTSIPCGSRERLRDEAVRRIRCAYSSSRTRSVWRPHCSAAWPPRDSPSTSPTPARTGCTWPRRRPTTRSSSTSCCRSCPATGSSSSCARRRTGCRS